MNSGINLIPWPEKIICREGSLDLGGGIAVVLPAQAGDAWRMRATAFKENLFKRFGLEAGISFAPDGGKIYSSVLTVETALSDDAAVRPFPEEAYELSVGETIRIAAGSPEGLHNAFTTLMQLIAVKDNSAAVPKLDISDSPRFSWRGTLIDPARNFLPAEVVKNFIDLISGLKINILHWHLVDDQGWRMESLIFPRLHEIGGLKGYYTQEQIRDIIDYAKRRNVDVLPEIDMPGHTSAMLAAYPELSCTGKPVEIRQRPGIFTSALCASNERVYEFIDRLMGEVSGLFPFPFIHIGSDEVVAGDWLVHDSCVDFMRKNNIEDKPGLHEYFVHRVDEILKGYGRRMIAWDETARFLPQDSIVQAWRNMKFTTIAAETGHDVIVSPTTHCYYDYPHLITSTRKAYSFEPVPETLDENLRSRIIGTQANLWGEWITPGRLTRRAFPRMLAHAEVCWSKKESRDYRHFKKRMHAVSSAMRKRGIRLGTRFEPFLLLWFGVMKLYEILFIRDKDKNN